MKTLRNIGAGVMTNLTLVSTAFAQSSQIKNPTGKTDLGGFINAILNGLFLFAGAVAVLFLVIGGFRYVISAGNPDQVEGAKKTILYAVVGLIIIFVAYVLTRFLLDALGVKSDFRLG